MIATWSAKARQYKRTVEIHQQTLERPFATFVYASISKSLTFSEKNCRLFTDVIRYIRHFDIGDGIQGSFSVSLQSAQLK